MARERDPRNQAALAETLGKLGDDASAPMLAILHGRRPISRGGSRRGPARAVDFRDRRSLNARLALIYDPNAPAWLVAAALPGLAAAGLLPPYDLASFLENQAPAVRAAALLSMNVKKALPADLKPVGARPARRPGLGRSARRRSWRSSPSGCPRPSLACSSSPASRNLRITIRRSLALCRLPDPRALPIYLAAIGDRNPQLRRAGESALLAIRDRVSDRSAAAARSASFPVAAALSLERVLARFEPIRSWRVIGPFPRTTPQVFVGEPAIDFTRVHAGAAGTDRSAGRPAGPTRTPAAWTWMT